MDATNLFVVIYRHLGSGHFNYWVTFIAMKPYTEYLIKNSQAVKKRCGPHKGHGEKRCEIQGGGQEMAVMVG